MYVTVVCALLATGCHHSDRAEYSEPSSTPTAVTRPERSVPQTACGSALPAPSSGSYAVVVYLQVDGRSVTVASGRGQILDDRLELDLVSSDGTDRYISADGQVGVSVAEGPPVWVDVDGPYPTGDDASLVSPPGGLGATPARIEQLAGQSLAVYATPLWGAVSTDTLALATAEHWRDDSGVSQRIVRTLTVGDGVNSPQSMTVIADRTDDADIGPLGFDGFAVPGFAFARQVAQEPDDPRSGWAARPAAGQSAAPAGRRDGLATPSDSRCAPEATTPRAAPEAPGSSSAPTTDSAEATPAPTSVPSSTPTAQTSRQQSGGQISGCSLIPEPGGGVKMHCGDREIESPPPPSPSPSSDDANSQLARLLRCRLRLVLTVGSFLNLASAPPIGAIQLVRRSKAFTTTATSAVKDCDELLRHDGTIFGDPHLRTFDGTDYDFQAIGEFVVARNTSFEVQVRYSGQPGVNTWTTATAIRSGPHVLELRHTGADVGAGLDIVLDGHPMTVDVSGHLLDDETFVVAQPNGAADSSELLVVTPTGSYVIVEERGLAQNVVVGVSATDKESVGLLGSPDRDPDNDLMVGNGAPLGADERHDRQRLYGDFAATWRVSRAERLFTDGDAETYLTAEYTAVPAEATRLSSFSPDAASAARKLCLAAGVTGRTALRYCTYDVLASGDDTWAQHAAGSRVLLAIEPPPPFRRLPAPAASSDHPLLGAADHCDLDRVHEQLAAGADPNLRRVGDGWTPLLFASQHDCLDVVDVLLAVGAEANVAAIDDATTPLYLAAQNGHQSVVDTLLAAGARPDTALTSGDTPLLIAAFRGHHGVVERLLIAHAYTDDARNDGFTPLLAAAQEGHAEVARTLLGAGADPAQVDSHHASALYLAVQGGHAGVVGVLLAAGVNPNLSLADGESPLMLASFRGDPGIVDALLAAGAAVNAARDDGFTALLAAAQQRHLLVVQRLLAGGADPNHTGGSSNRTALHHAASNDDRAMVEALLTSGADTQVVDANGATARDLAGPHLLDLFPTITSTGP